MRLAVFRTPVLIGAVFSATLGLYSQTTAGKETHAGEPLDIPPRATPNDYQAHTQAGALTLAAEFTGHFAATPEGTYTTEEYVVVEAAIYGEAGARIKVSLDDFSLRVSGKKTPLPCQPPGAVIGSLKDPEWEPPSSSKSKSKGGLSTGGSGADSDSTPRPVHVPVEILRSMAARVQKAALVEGDRTLPVAGLIFFQYRGKTKDIRSVELVYNGPGGQTTLALQP